MAIPIPRDPDLDLAAVPRHWMGGNPVGTAISNGINLLFPHGERFFVRSVNRYLEQLPEPTLRDQVRAFFKQEGHHAAAHDRFNAVLRAQGYEIDRFLDAYSAITRWVESRMPAKLNLAGTAAAEHYTAILAEGAFTRGVLDQVDPTMRELLAWHAAEEIEHKAVAFDVLRAIDPSYALRIAGLAYATVMLSAFWFTGAMLLLRQEKLGWRETWRRLRAMRREDPVLRRVFVRGIRQYIRKDFHPRDNANEHLARQWFAARGLPFTEAA